MTITITIEEAPVTASSYRIVMAHTVARLPDRLLGSVFLAAGALLAYLVLFDQGAAAAAIFGAAAGNDNLLHELFHDGRHLRAAPCH